MYRQPIHCDGQCRSFAAPKFLQMGAQLGLANFLELRGVIRSQENLVMHSLCITYQFDGEPLQIGATAAFLLVINADSPMMTFASLPEGIGNAGATDVVGNPNILFYKRITPESTSIETFSITDSVVIDMRLGLLASGTPISLYAGRDNFAGYGAFGVTLSYNSEKELS